MGWGFGTSSERMMMLCFTQIFPIVSSSSFENTLPMGLWLLRISCQKAFQKG